VRQLFLMNYVADRGALCSLVHVLRRNRPYHPARAVGSDDAAVSILQLRRQEGVL
jgi:hypothetical protein